MDIKIFCRCSLFPSWPGYGLISTPVVAIRNFAKAPKTSVPTAQ